VSGDAVAEAVRDGAALDLPPVDWGAGEPIEILFVDGAKSWTGLVSLLSTFGPSLVEGALVAFQDYKWWGAFWVPAIVEFLRDRLEVEHVLENNTVTFRARGAIGAGDISRIPAWDAVDPGDCAARLESAAAGLSSRGDDIGAAMVRLGATRMWQQKGSTDKAAAALRNAQLTWPPAANDYPLVSARTWLEESSGGSFAPPLRARLRRFWSRIIRRTRKQ